MPYDTNADLPGYIRDELPAAAQTIFRNAFNAAETKYAIGTQGIRIWLAWVAVKKAYKKKGDTWIKI